MTLLSPLAAAIAELAADPAVQALVGLDVAGVRRIRSIEPAAGDSLGPGAWLAFVVVTVLDSPVRPRTPVRDVILGIKAYAATDPAAEALWLACESVFADRGARRAASGLGVWHSECRSIGPDRDPATLQPLWHGTVSYPTTLASVT